MPNYHDEFWKYLLLKIDCAMEFFHFLLLEKGLLLNLRKLKQIPSIELKNKKIPIDLVFEIPLRKGKNKCYFLLEHKSRKEKNYLFQILQYRRKFREWQRVRFGRIYPTVPILFSQGLDGWDPEKELLEETIENPFLPEKPIDLLIFDLGKIDPTKEFQIPEMKAGMLLLKGIAKPWDEFIRVWREIQTILKSMERSKRLDLEDAMGKYIFKSRREENSLLQEMIMGRRILTAYERAVKEGELKGRQEGEFNKALETARRMRELGDSLDKVVRVTGLKEVLLNEYGIF